MNINLKNKLLQFQNIFFHLMAIGPSNKIFTTLYADLNKINSKYTGSIATFIPDLIKGRISLTKNILIFFNKWYPQLIKELNNDKRIK